MATANWMLCSPAAESKAELEAECNSDWAESHIPSKFDVVPISCNPGRQSLQFALAVVYKRAAYILAS
jgi:hypothetical protein